MRNKKRHRVSNIEELYETVKECDKGTLIIYREEPTLQIGGQGKGKTSGHYTKERLLIRGIKQLARRKKVTIDHGGNI